MSILTTLLTNVEAVQSGLQNGTIVREVVSGHPDDVLEMQRIQLLEGKTPTGRVSGLVYELSQAYKALSLDTRGLDRVCLQCNNHGVKYRTV